ncbi:MAG: hypothetical protein GY913_28075 [Proteobacteria bacterium]|nr:hypothetical protein [Pseudomonadota bacterium]MCP4920769.1 hypothetical protein [Pseudomonadota bacterium]
MLVLLTLFACNKDKDPTDTVAESGTDSTLDSEPLVEWCSPDGPALPSGATTDEWSVGPRLPAGDIVQLVEADDGTLVAGSALAGVFRSDDGGNRWWETIANITHVYGQLAIRPDDSDHMAYTSGALQYSSDGGRSYSEFRLSEGTDPKEQIRGMVFVDDGLLFVTEGGDVFSYDAEADSATLLGTIPDAGAGGPAPPHTSHELVATAWMHRGNDALFAYHGGRDLYRSTDGGVTWDLSANGQFAPNSLLVRGDKAWIVDTHEEQQVFHTDDGGETWDIAATVPVPVFGLAVLDDDETIVVAADESLYRGASGTLARLDVDVGHYYTSVHVTADGGLLTGHSTGIARSDDQGETWTEINDGLEDRDAAMVMSIDKCPGTLFVGTRCRSGMFVSSDWGESYERVDEYFHYVMVMDNHDRRTKEIWATSDESILLSKDFGATWEVSKVNVNEHDEYGKHVHGIAAHPTEQCTAIVGSVGSGIWEDDAGRAYKTTDCGANWNATTGIPESIASVHAIHYLSSNPDIVLAGTYRGGDIAHDGDPGIGLYRSTDAGDTWSKVGGDEVRDVPYIRECNGRLFAGTDVGVIGSDDDGASWTVLDPATQDTQVLALDCHEDLVLGMRFDLSLRRSDDGGETWTDFEDGLPEPKAGPGGALYTSSLDISADGTYAWVTPGEEGVYNRKL